MSFSKLFSKAINTSSNLAPTITKKVDVSDFSSTIKKTATNATSASSTASKKANLASTMKNFENVPGATGNLAKTTEFMSKNPKIALAGVTSLAAAGYVTAQMSNGKSFDEACRALGDLVGNAVEGISDATTSAAGGILDGFMTAIFGENWMNYVYGVLGLIGVLFFLKIYRLLRG